MRIAFVITRAYDVGGAQIHVRDMSKALAGLGHRPVVISGAPGPLSEQLRSAHVEFRSLPHLVWRLDPPRDALALLELRRTLRDLAPDLVSAHSSKAGILARVASRSLGIPVIFTAHGWGFEETRPAASRLFHKYAERLASPLADRIVTVCDANRRLAEEQGVLARGRAITVHNSMPDLSRRRLAEPGISRPTLTMVARFAAPKDHSTLLTALEGLLDLSWQLDLIGSGPEEQAARERVETGPLTERVQFHGYQSDVTSYLASSQSFILTSRSEGFPRSILEAMRSGLPVIASDVGGVSEAVVTGRTGYVIPVGDAAALRAALRTLVADPRLRERMGRESRKRYEKEFTFDRMLESTMRVYEEVLSRDSDVDRVGSSYRRGESS